MRQEAAIEPSQTNLPIDEGEIEFQIPGREAGGNSFLLGLGDDSRLSSGRGFVAEGMALERGLGRRVDEGFDRGQQQEQNGSWLLSRSALDDSTGKAAAHGVGGALGELDLETLRALHAGLVRNVSSS